MKPIEIGYEERKFIFYPRMMSVAEEAAHDVKFADVAETDTEKFSKQFDLCKEFLGEFSEKVPDELVKKKGELVKTPLGDGTPFEAINKVFTERTAENERIIRRLYSLYKSQLDPDFRFL